MSNFCQTRRPILGDRWDTLLLLSLKPDKETTGKEARVPKKLEEVGGQALSGIKRKGRQRVGFLQVLFSLELRAMGLLF